ncbi:MAG: Mth938-like domain-containing protein [Rhodocyclaceae bacterium]|nr:Mth938-like domain-containing protein [Rhodocyclaceae bacterium]
MLPDAPLHRNEKPVLARHCAPHRDPILKLHAAPRSSQHTITACGDDHVTIDGRRHVRSLLVQPDRLDPTWGPETFAALTSAHLASLLALPFVVLLLGTGRRQRFPAPPLLRPFYEAQRAIEIMDTAAACRTYNVLMSEGRAVAAALIIEAELGR